MLDDKDIEKLIKVQKEVFVTKEEFEGFMEVNAKRFDKIDENFDKMSKRFDKIDEKLDKVVELDHRVAYIENNLNIQPLKK
ncbi:MAG: hypothetical protein AAB352_03900 [Patescibacteria group bacterium]